VKDEGVRFKATDPTDRAEPLIAKGVIAKEDLLTAVSGSA
jgi:hypothetical protein